MHKKKPFSTYVHIVITILCFCRVVNCLFLVLYVVQIDESSMRNQLNYPAPKEDQSLHFSENNSCSVGRYLDLQLHKIDV